MEVSDKKITEFWNWFANNESELTSDVLSNQRIEELNNKILDMGDFNWEVREGSQKRNMLIISPGGDLDLLPYTEKIIKLAPELPFWEFYHYKPRKEWDYKLALHTDNQGVKKMLSVEDWQYVLYKFSDKTFDIIFKADNLRGMSEDEKYIISDIVLESILGEEKSLKYIKQIEFVEQFGTKEIGKESSLKNLGNHFEQLI